MDNRIAQRIAEEMKFLVFQLRTETRPEKDHSDPSTVEDCWDRLIVLIKKLEHESIQ